LWLNYTLSKQVSRAAAGFWKQPGEHTVKVDGFTKKNVFKKEIMKI